MNVSGSPAARRPLFLAAALICLLWGLLDNLGHLDDILRVGAWGAQLNSVLAMECKGFGVLFAMLWVERRHACGVAQWWHYPAAVIVGTFGGSSFYWLVSQPLLAIATQYRDGRPYEQYFTFVLRYGLHGAAIFGLAVVLYLVRRDAVSRHENLRALQAQSADVERQLTSVRLAASRLHIEPLDLQRRLTELAALYEEAPERGEQALLHISATLRAAVDNIASTDRAAHPGG
jgi:hypothetical protein